MQQEFRFFVRRTASIKLYPALSLGLTVLWSWLRGLGSNGEANTPEAIAKRYTSGGIPLKLESVDKYWGIKHELAR